jgi:flagellar basal body-associated protein FliL
LKKNLFIFAIITIIIISTPFIIASVRAYTDSQNRFSIIPPTGWTPKEGVQGTVVQFLGPDDPDVGAVNINIAIQSTDQTLQTIVANTKQQWSITYADYTLSTDRDVTTNGYDSHELEISASQNGSPFDQDTVLIVQNGQLYQLNYVAGPTTYSTYFDTWSTSAYTFTINQSASPSPTSGGVGFSFNFSITGLPFIILVVAIIVIIIVTVVVIARRKPKNQPAQSPPPSQPVQSPPTNQQNLKSLSFARFHA